MKIMSPHGEMPGARIIYNGFCYQDDPEQAEDPLQKGRQPGFRRVMGQQFEVIVESKPVPDGEDRLRRVFDVLLSPVSNSQEEPYPLQPDQTHKQHKVPTNFTSPPSPQKRS